MEPPAEIRITITQTHGSYKLVVDSNQTMASTMIIPIEIMSRETFDGLNCTELCLDMTHIDTMITPQVRSLSIIDHCAEVNLDHLTCLQHLHVQFSDINMTSEMLRVLASLETLDIDDIEPRDTLPYMPRLRKLRTNISKIDQLCNMTALTDLNAPISEHDLRSLHALKNQGSLTAFTLRTTLVGVPRISALAALPIVYLRIDVYPRDFHNITKLTNLRSLHVAIPLPNYVDLCMLAPMTRLDTLAIVGSTCKSVPGLCLMTNLTSLEITDCTHINATSLTTLTALTRLSFTGIWRRGGGLHASSHASVVACDDLDKLTMLTNLRTLSIQGSYRAGDHVSAHQLADYLGISVEYTM